jgi:hypothetical protein
MRRLIAALFLLASCSAFAQQKITFMSLKKSVEVGDLVSADEVFEILSTTAPCSLPLADADKFREYIFVPLYNSNREAALGCWAPIFPDKVLTITEIGAQDIRSDLGYVKVESDGGQWPVRVIGPMNPKSPFVPNRRP